MRTFAVLSLVAPALAFVPRAPVCPARGSALRSTADATSLTNLEAPTIESWLQETTSPQLGESTHTSHAQGGCADCLCSPRMRLDHNPHTYPKPSREPIMALAAAGSRTSASCSSGYFEPPTSYPGLPPPMSSLHHTTPTKGTPIHTHTHLRAPVNHRQGRARAVQLRQGDRVQGGCPPHPPRSACSNLASAPASIQPSFYPVCVIVGAHC